MKYLSLVLVLALVSVVKADELILKDGRKVEWTDLHDAGDSYEVTTPAGTKVTVKKDDVDRFLPKKAEAPLTGATVTFDKKVKLDTVDLLSKVDPKKDGIGGQWRLNGVALTVTAGSEVHSKLATSFTPPEEFDLTMTVSRKDGAGEFFVGLIGGGQQFTIHFDASQATMSAVWQIDGTGGGDGTGVPGKFFANGVPKTITCMVRREALVVRVDGKDFIVWKANWKRVSLHPALVVPSKNVLFFGAGGGGNFQITKAVVTLPKEKP